MRIQDFKKDFDLKVNEMLDDFELHQKTSLGVEVAGTKRRAIASKYSTYKRYAKGDFVSV